MTESGLLVLDKPSGLTSHDVVARVRRILGTRKVGHAGTLDPMATGVLVVGVNRATRLLGHLALQDKRYLATVRLGTTTVSDDADGEVVTVAPTAVLEAVTDEGILASAARFHGPIEQRPSSVSAIKVDGRRAYDRVRSGEDVELASRAVTVSRLDVVSISHGASSIDVEIDVECSTGTYVRALARDIGALLGVGGHLTSLRRTRVGPFDQPIGLTELEESAASALIEMSAVARDCFVVWDVDEDQARAVRFGQRIPWFGPDGAGAAV
ncbi:MAG: tRNA pseudouridine(55) synthase TruB, partial [bacterium]|nr:tRNA pseudouridine(55) synthase TruB [bacterium]